MRLAAVGTSGALIAGLLMANSPARAVEADPDPLDAYICVSNNQGGSSRLAILDEDRHVLQVFRLNKGCRILRLGVDLPAGHYIVKHRAPSGRLTGRVTAVTATCDENGGCIGGGVSRDRNEPSPRLKKVKSARFVLSKYAAGAVFFESVKNRHR
jgi:hypothetical protein